MAFRLNRKPHKLDAIWGTQTPEHFIAFDTETYAIDGFDKCNGVKRAVKYHYLKLGVAGYWTGSKIEWFDFNDIDYFWDWVESKFYKDKMKIYLFAHNMHFDLRVVDIFGNLIKRGWEQTNHPIIDNGTIILRYRKNNCSLEVLDTFNIFKQSVAEIGEYLNLPKLSETIDMERSVNDKNYGVDVLKVYCRRDVEIILRKMLSWFEFIVNNRFGGFQPTIASQGLACYRARWLYDGIQIHCIEKALKMERESYHGGRNEAFRIGDIPGPIYVLDVNSLYPSIMKGNDYPIEFVRYRGYNDTLSLKHDLNDYCVIARLKIKVNKPLYAKKTDRLLFPIGTFWGTFTSPEIERMINDNSIIEIGESCVYKKAEIFNDFINKLYELKINAPSDAMADDYKRVMNAMGGKWGQMVKETTYIEDVPTDEIKSEIIMEIDSDITYKIASFGGKKYKYESKRAETMNSFPGISSFICSYGRMKLLEFIEMAGWENVYYCDTDSIFTNSEGLERCKKWVDNKKLGYLKMDDTADKLRINGNKDYVLFNSSKQHKKIEKMVAKGIISIDTVKDYNVTKIKGVSLNKKTTRQISYDEYSIMKFDKLISAIHEGNLSSVKQFYQTKKLKRIYIKGNVDEKGIVTPFEMIE